VAAKYPVDIVFDAVDRVTGSMRRINSRIERMTGPMKNLNNRMRALSRASGFVRLQESIGNVGRATGRVARQFGALATKIGLLGGLAVGVLVRIVSGVAETGDNIAKSVRSIGISAQFLQEYQFVAERMGITQDALNKSFFGMAKRLGEMKSGYGTLSALLKKTNPQLMRQLMATKSTEESFSLLMSAMEKIEDPTVRAAFASAAFGRQGLRMANIARAGSEEVERLRRRAHELGLVLSDDALDASERYQDSLTDMKSAMAGLTNIIGASLMPVFSDLMDRMTVFFVNNRGQIQAWAENFVSRIPGALSDLQQGAMALLDRLQPLTDTIQWMFETFGTGETILAGVAVVMGGPLLAAIGSLATAFVSLGVAIGFTPIGWILAGIAGIAAAVWAASKAVDYVRDNWGGVWEFVSDSIGWVIDALALVGDALLGNFGSVMARLRRMGEAVTRMVPDWLKDWLAGSDEKTVTVRDERSGGARGGVEGARGAIQSSTRTERRESRVTVDFRNVPRGARVSREGADDDGVDLSMGHAMAMP
jgi:hypothetical protein